MDVFNSHIVRILKQDNNELLLRLSEIVNNLVTIQQLPTDCINEILSSNDDKSIGNLWSTSKLFKQYVAKLYVDKLVYKKFYIICVNSSCAILHAVATVVCVKM